MAHWIAPAFIFVTVSMVACNQAIPPDRSPGRVPPPPVASGPREVPPPPPIEVPPPISTTRLPLEPLPSGVPSCPLYCRLLATHCSANPSVVQSEEGCLRECRASTWESGTPGDRTGSSLACRLSWAQAAAQDPRACADAGTVSPSCSGGVVPPPRVVQVAPFTPGKCVLGVYDSTDAPSWNAGGRSRDVILGKRVTELLKKKGFAVRLVDANDGLPQDVGGCRAVVTSFYDGTLKDAAGYSAWLAAVIDSGRRVLILGDYGAYQDAASRAWMEHDIVNKPLRALGVVYASGWTNDSTKLNVTARDKSLYPEAPSTKRAEHYYQFLPTGPDVKVALEITRTDLQAGKSAVAFTSSTGGMALTRYYEDRDGVEVVKLGALLDRALGL